MSPEATKVVEGAREGSAEDPGGPATWMAELARSAREDRERFAALGFADLRLVVEVRGAVGVTRFGIVLDGYDVEVTGVLGPEDGFEAEAVLSGEETTFAEMMAAIATGGRADGAHTLNTLSIAGWPLELSGPDPMGRDKFFRYAETLQELFDGTGRP